jgi:hypothetical protein
MIRLLVVRLTKASVRLNELYWPGTFFALRAQTSFADICYLLPAVRRWKSSGGAACDHDAAIPFRHSSIST